MTSRPRLAALLLLLAFAAASGASGCRSLQIEPASTAPSDWRTEGGSAERTHRIARSIRPPLAVAWTHNVDAAVGHGGAVVAGSHVLVPTRRGEIIALDAGTGQRLGRARLAGPVDGAPLLVGNLLITTSASGGTTLAAVDLRSDRTRWRRDVGPVETSPVRVRDAVVVASVEGTISSFAIADGDIRWEAHLDGEAGIHASPAAAGDSLVVVGDDRGRITALDGTTGDVVWSTPLGDPIYSAASIAGTRIIVPTTRGRVHGLAGGDGRVLWTTELGGEGVRLSSAAVAGNRLVVTGTDGRAHALSAASGDVEWRIEGGAGMAAPALIADDVAYLATLDGRLFAVDIGSGEMIWTITLRGPMRAAPVPAGDGILVFAEPRYVIALVPAVD